MRIINFKKFIRTQFLILMVVFIFLLFFNQSSYSYNNKSFITIYIAKGDTLWSIASNLQDSNYYKGKDIRYIINDIKDINNITSSNLSVGDSLNIPVE